MVVEVIPYNAEYDLELSSPLSSIHRAGITNALPTHGVFVPHVERKTPMTKLMEQYIDQSKSLLLCLPRI